MLQRMVYIKPVNIRTWLTTLMLMEMAGLVSGQFSCKPIKMGESISYSCKCPGDTGSNVYWYIEGDRNPYRCDHNYSSLPESHLNASKYQVTFSPNFKVSTLRVNNVSVNDASRLISCREVKGSSSGIVREECRLEPYLSPESPECSAEQISRSMVRFQCRTTRVYPALKCLVTPFHVTLGVTSEVYFSDSAWNITRSELPGGLYSSACVVDIRMPHDGDFQFFGVLKPDLSVSVWDSSVPVKPTDVITMKSLDVKVNIYKETSAPTTWICAEAEPQLVFLCEAEGFYGHPSRMEWWLQPDSTKIQGVVLLKGSKYESRISVTAKKYKNENSVIYCIWYYMKKQYTNLTHYGVKWLNDSILFLANIQHLENDSQFPNTFFAQKENVSLTCKVAKGNYFISAIQVACYDNKTIIFYHELQGNEISLNLNNIKGKRSIWCNCSAAHTLKCAVKSYNFNIISWPLLTSQERFSSSHSQHDSDQLLFITLGVASGVLLLLCVGLAKKIKKICFKNSITPPPTNHYDYVRVTRRLNEQVAEIDPYATTTICFPPSSGRHPSFGESSGLYVNVDLNPNT